MTQKKVSNTGYQARIAEYVYDSLFIQQLAMENNHLSSIYLLQMVIVQSRCQFTNLPKQYQQESLTKRTLEKYEFVNWDDEFPNINGKIKTSCSSHHQPINSVFSIWRCGEKIMGYHGNIIYPTNVGTMHNIRKLDGI